MTLDDSQHPISDAYFKMWFNEITSPEGVDWEDWIAEDYIAVLDMLESLSVPDALIFYEIQSIILAFNLSGVYAGDLIYRVICNYEIAKKKSEAAILEAVLEAEILEAVLA
jgi:hypothetical protein